jgi:glycosyltransferase involved in cell wall biosynthesis
MLMEKMKLLYLNAPTSLAGAERVILTYLQHHDREQFLPQVMSYLNEFRPDNEFTREVERLGIGFSRVRLRGYRGLGRQITETAHLIKRAGVSVIHSHGYRSDIIGMLAARRAGVPIISTLHGWTPVNRSLRIYEAIDRLVLRWFDHIICVSRPLYEQMLRTLPSHRVTLLPNAVSTLPVDGFSPTARGTTRKTILFVGRLSYEKGVDVLLRAYAHSFFGHDDTRLLILGDGPDRTTYEQLAHDLRINDQVEFLGFQRDVQSFYRSADLYVLASRSEGLPLSLLEAMSAGLPLVATRVGGVPDVIQDGFSGCLVPSNDHRALGVALKNLLDKPDQAAVMAESARAVVTTHYRAEPWARNIEKIYRMMG